MAIEITIPRLGWSMEEGTFGEWLKAAGEPVQPGDMVYILEGEKATHEIESIDSGFLCIPDDAPQPGDTVMVGQAIGFLLAEGESPPASVYSFSSDNRAAAAQPQAPPSAATAQQADLPAASPLSIPDRSRTAVTPRARRRAKELGMDWEQISGTGRGGRIRECDVNAADSRTGNQTPREILPVPPGQQEPTSKLRQTIAQRMLAGVQHTAPVTLTTKVDAAGLVALRTELKTEAKTVDQIVPSYNDIIVKLVAVALTEHARMNSCWHRDSVYIFDAVNIAVAIDTEFGLVAPVINNVTSLSLKEVAEQSFSMIEQARAGTLSQSQLQGGTFTVSNLGMFDIEFFTPILNLPQSATLGIGRIVREPVVRDETVVAGETLSLSLTFDHRVIDGAPAARWLQRLTQLIRQPASVLGGKPC